MDFVILCTIAYRLTMRFVRRYICLAPLALGAILCFLPIMIDSQFYEPNDINFTSQIYTSISTRKFEFALVANIASLTPISLDRFLDLIRVWKNGNAPKSGVSLQPVLMMTIVIPDLLILLYAIPTNSPRLVVCLLNLRNIIIFNSIFRLLLDCGKPIFKPFLSHFGISVTIDVTAEYLTGFVYLGTVLSVLLHFLSNRISKRESFQLHKKLDEVKRSFMRFISHEVRTPLNIILLGVDVIHKEMKYKSCNQDSMDTLNDMKDSCDKCVGILDELLDFEKIESGILLLDRTLFSAWDIISISIKNLEIQAKKSGVQIVMPTTGSVMATNLRKTMLNVDQEKIGFALQNLLQNVLKSTARGGILTITASVTEGVIATAKTYSTEVQPILRLHISSSAAFIPVTQKSIGNMLKRTISRMNSTVKVDDESKRVSIDSIRALIDIHCGSLSFESDNLQQRNTIMVELPAVAVAHKNHHNQSNKQLNNSNQLRDGAGSFDSDACSDVRVGDKQPQQSSRTRSHRIMALGSTPILPKTTLGPIVNTIMNSSRRHLVGIDIDEDLRSYYNRAMVVPFASIRTSNKEEKEKSKPDITYDASDGF
eukprot:gene4967-9938_t